MKQGRTVMKKGEAQSREMSQERMRGEPPSSEGGCQRDPQAWMGDLNEARKDGDEKET